MITAEARQAAVEFFRTTRHLNPDSEAGLILTQHAREVMILLINPRYAALSLSIGCGPLPKVMDLRAAVVMAAEQAHGPRRLALYNA